MRKPYCFGTTGCRTAPTSLWLVGWTGDVHFIDCGVLIRFRGQRWGSGAHGHVSWLDTGHGVGVSRLFDHHLCGRLHQYGISGGLPMSPSREVQLGADALWDHFQDRTLITAFSMFSHVPTPNSGWKKKVQVISLYLYYPYNSTHFIGMFHNVSAWKSPGSAGLPIDFVDHLGTTSPDVARIRPAAADLSEQRRHGWGTLAPQRGRIFQGEPWNHHVGHIGHGWERWISRVEDAL